MITEKKRVPVYLTEECYQMMDENRRKHSDMDDSEYLEMLIHDNDSIDALEKYDEKILKAVQNVLLSSDRLEEMLSRENLKDNKAIKAYINSIEDNAERFREYFLLNYKAAHGIKEDS